MMKRPSKQTILLAASMAFLALLIAWPRSLMTSEPGRARGFVSPGGGFVPPTKAGGGVADDAVTDAKLRDSTALSVIGRSVNSIGDPADISASVDGHVLRRSGTSLGFGQVATAGIADDAVTLAKVADIATSRILGRITAGTGDAEELTGTQVTSLLDAVTTSAKGLVPTAPNDTNKFLRGDGTWASPPSSLPVLAEYGLGVAGDLTFDGSSTVQGVVPSGGVYTLNRDITGRNVTVNNGATIKTANYRVLASETLTNNGLIHNNGNNASGSTAGAALSAAVLPSTLAGAAGRTGSGAGASSSGSTSMPTGWPTTSLNNGGVSSAGGTGTALGHGGGGGGSAGGAGGTAGSLTSYSNGNGAVSSLGTLMTGRTLAISNGAGTVVFAVANGGGAGGSTGTTGSSGGGGAGGGMLVVAAKTIAGSGTFAAKGGNGGNGTLGDGTGQGGGGGGGGGMVVLIYSHRTGSTTIDVSGGTGGSAAGVNAGRGGDGAGGVSLPLNMSGDGT